MDCFVTCIRSLSLLGEKSTPILPGKKYRYIGVSVYLENYVIIEEVPDNGTSSKRLLVPRENVHLIFPTRQCDE